MTPRPIVYLSIEKDYSSTKSNKSISMLLVDKERKMRGKRSTSIKTRASRETLQEYIYSKCKKSIKASSLEQYLQHIQAYNIALGFGWDVRVFDPIIKKAIDELRNYEQMTLLKTGNNFPVYSSQFQQPTLIDSAISQQLDLESNSLDSNFNSTPDFTLFTIEDITMNDEILNERRSPFYHHGGTNFNTQTFSSYQTLSENLTNHQEINYFDNYAYEYTLDTYANNFFVEKVDGLSGEENVQASNMEESSNIMKSFEINTIKKPFNVKSRFKWTKKSTKLLLSFLKEHKEELKELVEKRGGSGNNKKELWECASIRVSDNQNQYIPEPEQCEYKWKNIKQACKRNPDYQYKFEVEEILN
ncbi:7016_t:CDS:2 [Funneliformis geosporum]|uniref:5253_t:CDS:1 n=1 Tax=Funneliformis geosporum TaxID=1117311 RepID=A0A9W4SXM3_9GLOM|nr:5253_t:CDS:2 [Funneliformis geosporum]CAI2187272.1 7016_t:CDS:2 [Funneliformis geosporum]